MTNFEKLCEKEAEEFITETIKGLKSIRREAKEAIRNLKELELLNRVDSDE